MRSIRIVHAADLHLDSGFCGSRLGLAARLRAEELKESFLRLVDLCQRGQADLLLIAGDLFETCFVRKSTVKMVAEALAGLDRTGVYISPGNHDPWLSGSYYRSQPWPDNVHIFGPRWETVELPELGAAIHGWGFDRYEVREPVLRRFKVPDPSAINIVLLHGTFGPEGAASQYLPVSLSDIEACGADYVALGHVHKADLIRSRGRFLRAAYPGSLESLDFGSSPEHGVLVGTLDKIGADLTLEKIGVRDHRSLEVDLTGIESPDEAAARILGVAGEGERLRDLFRLTLSGRVDPELDLDAEILRERLSREFFFLDLINETRPDHDYDRLVRENSVRGIFVRRIVDRLRTAGGEGREEEARILQDALRIGLDAFGGRIHLR